MHHDKACLTLAQPATAPDNGAMQQPDSGRVERIETLSRAISEWRLVQTTYNGAEMTLAPHQIFLRHDAMFVSAFNPAKNWRGPEDYRLSYFNVSGLGDVRLQERGFRPLPDYDGSLPRPDDLTLFALEAA